MTQDVFRKGIALLQAALARKYEPATVQLLWSQLRDEFTDQQWSAEVTHLARTCEFLPPLAVFYKRRNAASGTALTAQAAAAFDAITRPCRQCRPNVGAPGYRYDRELIREHHGECAARAFLASGGSASFDVAMDAADDGRELGFLRHRFMKSFDEEHRRLEIEPAPERPALPPSQARGLLAELARDRPRSSGADRADRSKGVPCGTVDDS